MNKIIAYILYFLTILFQRIKGEDCVQVDLAQRYQAIYSSPTSVDCINGTMVMGVVDYTQEDVVFNQDTTEHFIKQFLEDFWSQAAFHDNSGIAPKNLSIVLPIGYEINSLQNFYVPEMTEQIVFSGMQVVLPCPNGAITDIGTVTYLGPSCDSDVALKSQSTWLASSFIGAGIGKWYIYKFDSFVACISNMFTLPPTTTLPPSPTSQPSPASTCLCSYWNGLLLFLIYLVFV